VNPEPEEPVTHEEAVPISSPSLEIPEVDAPLTAETEPEPHSTNFISDDQVSTFEVEEQHVLVPPENPEAVNIELNDDSTPLAATELSPEVAAPVLETFESEAQHSVEESKVSFTLFLQQDNLFIAIKYRRRSISLKLPVNPRSLFQMKVGHG
jgi:hypothetical protein